MNPDITDNPPELWRSDELAAVTVDSKNEVRTTVQSSRRISTPSKQVSTQLDFRHRVAFALASVPEVQAVFTSEYSKVFFVWTVVAERSPEVYEKLYKIEQELIEANQSIQFDFTVMASRGHDPRDVITDPLAQIAYSRS